MFVDLQDVRWTQAQLALAEAADNKTIHNYIQHKHVEPKRVQGRRLFTGLLALEIGVTSRLAQYFSIPPKNGIAIAKVVLAGPPAWLAADARDGFGKIDPETWIKRSSQREQVSCFRDDAGNLTLGTAKDASGIDLIVPAQMFSRTILVGLVRSTEAD